MMTPHTVRQLLQVFTLFRENRSKGAPLNRSFHDAVRTVAKNFSVTYQTIEDGCRRRLELTNINELYEMLSAWMDGEPRALLHQLKRHSDPAAHVEIDKLFSSPEASTPKKAKMAAVDTSREELILVSLHLNARDARLLRALLELEGEEAIANTVSVAVRDRMKIVAHGLIDEGTTRS